MALGRGGRGGFNFQTRRNRHVRAPLTEFDKREPYIRFWDKPEDVVTFCIDSGILIFAQWHDDYYVIQVADQRHFPQVIDAVRGGYFQ